MTHHFNRTADDRISIPRIPGAAQSLRQLNPIERFKPKPRTSLGDVLLALALGFGFGVMVACEVLV